MEIRPASARTAPVRIFTRVDLPAPFAPISAWTSPGRIDSDPLRNAATAPYRFTTPAASRRGSVDTTIRRGNRLGQRGCDLSRAQPLALSDGKLFARAFAGDDLILAVGGPVRDRDADRPFGAER